MKPLRLNKSKQARDRAREFRKNMSVSEKWFWSAVRHDALGFRFRRQYSIGPYFLDFYVPSARVCIEIDGEQHAERQEADAKRDAYLAEMGILTIRIPSLDLFYRERDLYSQWVHEVARVLREREALHPPAPSSRKRKEGE
jgi:very-short-patch-repair endonuclease